MDFSLYVFDIPQRVEGEHVLFQPLIGCYRAQFPAAVAGRYELNKRQALSGHGIFKSLPNSLFRLTDIGRSVDALSGDITYALQMSHHIGNLVGVAMMFRVATLWRGRCGWFRPFQWQPNHRHPGR